MKRAVSVLIMVIFASMLGGCILSKTPTSNKIAMSPVDKLTFSVNVFPPATYTWTLDGEPLSNTGKSYDYTASPGSYTLTVKASHFLGIDTQTWEIEVNNPTTELLDSLVTIPAGSFMMGSNELSLEQPIHQVTLQSFDIGRYEVTQAQYQAVMSTNPSYFKGANYPDSGNRPVEMVSYYDAKTFCQQLSAMTGRTFTLPSEAQWEYACRAGTTTLYSWGDSDSFIGDYAWWYYNSDSQTHPVGTKLPNPWGLYDMHGNVWEWCLDSWHSNYTGAPSDGSAWEPDTGSYRVIRGGGWYLDYPLDFLSASRYGNYPVDWSDHFGFRVVAVQ